MVAIVLLPGMDGTGALFDGFVSAIRGKLNPIVVSYPKNRPLGYRELESFARRHLPSNEPYVLLGESFSGPVAVSLAASKPAGLVGLVLCCSFVRNPMPVLKPLKKLLGLIPLKARYIDPVMPLLFGRFSSAVMHGVLRRSLEQTTEGVLRKRLAEVLAVDYSEKLRQVEVPVLYLQASEDRIVPRSALRLVSKMARFSQSVTLQAPHMLLQALPAEAAIIVTKYVEGTVASFNKARNQELPQAVSLPR